MSAYVLIITIAMVSYDGGVAVNSIPFATAKACEDAAKSWNNKDIGIRGRARVNAECHATGARP